MSKPKIPRNFIVAAIIYSAIATLGYLIAPIEVRFIESLTDNPTQISLLYAVGTLSLAALSILTGYLADKGYRHKTIYLGLLFTILYPLLYANVVSALQFAGVRLVWAVAGAAASPMLMGYIHDSLRDYPDKGKSFGYLYAIGSITGAIAQLAGGAITENFGYSATYYVGAVLGILIMLFSVTFLKDTQVHRQARQEKINPFSGFSYITSKPPLVFYLVNNIATGVNFGVKYILLPLIVFDIARSDTTSGAVFSVMGVVAFFVLISPRFWNWADRLNPYRIYMFSLSMLSIGALLISSAGSLSLIWIAAAIFALGEASSGPAQGRLLTEQVDKRFLGRVLAADDVMDKAFITISPVLATFLLNFFSAQGVFAVYGLLTVLSLVISNYIYITLIQKI